MNQNDRIYLQVCKDSMSEQYGEVTWCQDRVYDSDVEYIRADLAEQQLAECEKKVKRLQDTLYFIRDGHTGLYGEELRACNKALDATSERFTPLHKTK